MCIRDSTGPLPVRPFLASVHCAAVGGQVWPAARARCQARIVYRSRVICGSALMPPLRASSSSAALRSCAPLPSA
eukprot:4832337-Amphidinium_carterae.1